MGFQSRWDRRWQGCGCRRAGKLDILDAFFMARKVADKEPLANEWDFNHDGIVDGKDVDVVALASSTSWMRFSWRERWLTRSRWRTNGISITMGSSMARMWMSSRWQARHPGCVFHGAKGG